MSGATAITYRCGCCGRPGSAFVFIGGVPYHDECTHGPDYKPIFLTAPPPTEDQLRRIVREEIERLKDQIEAGLGVRP